MEPYKQVPDSKDSTLLVNLKEWIKEPVVASFIAGGVAGAVSRTVVSPMERLKIIHQVQMATGKDANYTGIASSLKRMFREEGWRAFFRGNGINCIRIFPYSAVQFSSYTIYKSMIFDDTESSALQKLAAGALAGITSVFATYPLDIVRTRLSIQTATIVSGAPKQTESMWSTTKSIYRNEGGFKALYRGIIPTTMGVAPYVGINFAVYETMRALFEDPGPLEKLLCGAVAGGVAQTITYPFDVLRRRFQVVSMGKGELGFAYNSVWGAIRTIIQKEGVIGMYKGLTANLLKVAPSMASSWVSFEYTRQFLLGK